MRVFLVILGTAVLLFGVFVESMGRVWNPGLYLGAGIVILAAALWREDPFRRVALVERYRLRILTLLQKGPLTEQEILDTLKREFLDRPIKEVMTDAEMGNEHQLRECLELMFQEGSIVYIDGQFHAVWPEPPARSEPPSGAGAD